MKKILKAMLLWFLFALAIIVAVTASYFGGFLIRWCVWFVGAIYEFIFGGNTFTHWVANHDGIVHIICSIFCFFLIIAIMVDAAEGSKKSGGTHTSQVKKETSNYFSDVEDMKRRNFSFVDCSGAYRRYGDTFIDHKGNYCRWGTGFYDYDDNYIQWGNTFKDSSGAYRRWGDDFVDGAGHWVTNVPK